MWHHEHHFEELENGNVKMTDIVNYKMPLGFLGQILAGKLVSDKVTRIFEGRRQILTKILG